jgi:hypothetical protein
MTDSNYKSANMTTDGVIQQATSSNDAFDDISDPEVSNRY